jgi:hypothetical protein
MSDNSATLAERFWKKVVKHEMGCWEWNGSNVKGRGTINLNRRPALAPRVSWELHFGPIPPGLFVLHHCDNPACTRPDHLFVGTQSDNLLDASRKGRLKGKKLPKGEDHHAAKLTDEDVLLIRATMRGYGIAKRLAEQFGVDRSLIHLIWKRRIWTHL